MGQPAEIVDLKRVENCIKIYESDPSKQTTEGIESILTLIAHVELEIEREQLIKLFGSLKTIHSLNLETIRKEINRIMFANWDSAPFFDGFAFRPKAMADLVTENESLWLKPLDKQGINAELLIYNPEKGIYEHANRRLQFKIRTKLGEKQASRYVSETIAYIEQSSAIQNPPEKLDYIVCKNHIVDFKASIAKTKADKKPNWQFIEKSHEHYLTTFHDIEFIPNSKCPDFEGFLKEVAANIDGDGERTERPNSAIALAEMIGSIIHQNSPRLNKAFLLSGTDYGNNGKSTLLNAITSQIIGNEHIISQGLEKIGGDNRFALSNIKGKVGVIVPDLPSNMFLSEEIKSIISGDWVSGEIKGVQGSNEFKSWATLIAGCNQLPRLGDQTKAFVKRWIVIPFDREFPDNKDFAEQFEKMCFENRNAIFSFCLEKYLLACVRNAYTEPEGMAEVRTQWIMENNPIADFCQECIKIDITGRESGKQLYEEYRYWHKERVKRRDPVTSKSFHAALRRFFSLPKQSTIKIDGKAHIGYKGITFIPPAYEKPDEIEFNL